MTRGLVVVTVLAAAGCDSPPRAPALTADAVFVSAAGGFRFVVPEKWVMTSRAEPPAGPLNKPLLLVRYLNPHPEKSGELDVFAADVPAGRGIDDYLAAFPVGADKWTAGPVEAATIAAVPARRFGMTPAGKTAKNLRRDVTAFPAGKGDRVYLFVMTFKGADAAVRDQVRECLNSFRWE